MSEPKRYYAFKMSVRLSKNYNSAEASVEYGEDARPDDTFKTLTERVENGVFKRLQSALAEVDEILSTKK